MESIDFPKEIGETNIFPYDRPEDKELAGHFFESVYRYNDLIVEKVEGDYDLIHCHDWLTMKAGIKLKEINCISDSFKILF